MQKIPELSDELIKAWCDQNHIAKLPSAKISEQAISDRCCDICDGIAKSFEYREFDKASRKPSDLFFTSLTDEQKSLYIEYEFHQNATTSHMQDMIYAAAFADGFRAGLVMVRGERF